MTEEKLSRLKMFTLLLVEDDEELLNKLNVILSIFFKEVITAQNGKDALEIYSTQKIDMIISDYSMPLMSGYELLKEIRKENKKIPLTIISNYSDKEKLLNPKDKSSRFGWFLKLISISDQHILKNCGEEVLFYLKYEKYVAILFLIMSVFNIPVIIIYYKSSYSNQNLGKEITFLQRFTVASLFDMENGSENGN